MCGQHVPSTVHLVSKQTTPHLHVAPVASLVGGSTQSRLMGHQGLTWLCPRPQLQSVLVGRALVRTGRESRPSANRQVPLGRARKEGLVPGRPSPGTGRGSEPSGLGQSRCPPSGPLFANP